MIFSDQESLRIFIVTVSVCGRTRTCVFNVLDAWLQALQPQSSFSDAHWSVNLLSPIMCFHSPSRLSQSSNTCHCTLAVGWSSFSLSCKWSVNKQCNLQYKSAYYNAKLALITNLFYFYICAEEFIFCLFLFLVVSWTLYIKENQCWPSSVLRSTFFHTIFTTDSKFIFLRSSLQDESASVPKKNIFFQHIEHLQNWNLYKAN